MAIDDSPIDSKPIDASITVTTLFIPIAELFEKHNMAIRNQTLTVNFLAWDTSANSGKTGDSANFTLRLIKDGGVPAAPTNAVSEPDSTNMPGNYELALTATEMDADFVTLAGISSTSNVVIIPLHITTESGDLAVITAYVDSLETRLTAARAGYLDNLSAGAVAQASVCSETRLSELDAGTAGKMANQVDIVQTDTTTDIPALIAGLNDPTAAAIAAAVYTYNMGNSRTIGEALAFLRNKWTISSNTLTVYDTDDTTVLWTSAITTTPANPVNASDPA